jgi:hypothetical protein
MSEHGWFASLGLREDAMQSTSTASSHNGRAYRILRMRMLSNRGTPLDPLISNSG